MSGGEVNQTELIAAMINQKDTYVDGIINVLRKVKGSISFMLMTKDGLYLVRDKLGRTPLNMVRVKMDSVLRLKVMLISI